MFLCGLKIEQCLNEPHKYIGYTLWKIYVPIWRKKNDTCLFSVVDINLQLSTHARIQRRRFCT